MKVRIPEKDFEKLYAEVIKVSFAKDPHIEEGAKIGQTWSRSIVEVEVRFVKDFRELERRTTCLGAAKVGIDFYLPAVKVGSDFSLDLGRILRFSLMTRPEKERHPKRGAMVYDMGEYCNPPVKFECEK